MEIAIGKSTKLKDTLIYCNFEYWKHRENRNGTIKWRCAKYRHFSCNAMLTTDHQKKIIGKVDIQHTHEGSVANARARKAIANMKSRVTVTNATPSSVQATVISSLSDGVLMALPRHSTINRCLQRHRMKLRATEETGQKMANEISYEAVLLHSGQLPVEPVEVKGYDFNNGINYPELLKSFYKTGFQATNLSKAVHEINRMINKKLEPLPQDAQSEINLNPCLREKSSCTIFLGYTSNMISSGVRETIRFLAEHNMIDCIVTTAGGVEEDFIKCLAPTYLGEFTLLGTDLRDRGINRIGNLLAPNDNYCKFEDWLMPILDKMVEEQKEQGIIWTPSKVIARLGKEIDNPESVYYWCYKNNIPVFSPALTDGSLGDMIYFHSYKNPGLVIDIVEDLRRINQMAVYSLNTGMIILGGGVVKHHICNANLMRNGADFSVFINTAQEFDGSDAGARPDEAVSWGKIKKTATPVKVYGEASIIFPLVVAETFAKQVEAGTKEEP